MKQLSWVSTGQILAALLQLLLLLLILRRISPESFGLLSAVLGIGIALQAVFDFGLYSFIIREHAIRPREDGTIAGALKLNSYSSIALILISGIALTAASFLSSNEFLYMVPLALSLGLEKNADTWIGVALAEGKAHFSATNLVLRRALAVLLFVLLEQLISNPILVYSVSVAVASVVSVLFVRNIVTSLLEISSPAPLAPILRSARSFYINGLSVHSRNLDAMVLTILGTPLLAGLYTASKRIISPLILVPTALATVLLPAVSRASRAKQEKVPAAILYLSLLTAIPYAAIAFSLPTLVPIVLGNAYNDSILPMQVLTLSLPFAVAATTGATFLQAVGQAKATALIALSSTVFFLIGISIAALTSSVLVAVAVLAATPILQTVLQSAWLFAMRRKK